VSAPTLLADLRPPVLVVGGYGYRNVGDEAMLAGLLRLLARRDVTVVSRSPAETTALHGVRSMGIGGAVTALRHHRTLLIGGGGLFGRDMGLLGRLLPAYGLFAAATGRSVTLVGIGLDDDRRLGRLVGRLAAQAEEVAVRDQRSAALLARHGVAAQLIDDLSAHMPAAPRAVGDRLLRGADVDPRRPVVGVCVTGVRDELAPAIEAAIADCVQRLPELQFCLIPMSQHPFVARHNDLLFARRIQAAAPRARVLDGFHHPAAVLSVVGRLSALVGMRYHSLLFARRAGVPSVPISYAPKVDAWLAEQRLAAVAPDGAAITAALTRLLDSEAVA
jgi:polysaccharide pyruvyl transferase WcaK-like protein